MTTPQDGGAAFPRTTSFSAPGVVHMAGHQGMSLRDWFAGMAMQSLIQEPPHTKDVDKLLQHLGVAAYKAADAMLAERAKGQS